MVKAKPAKTVVKAFLCGGAEEGVLSRGCTGGLLLRGGASLQRAPVVRALAEGGAFGTCPRAPQAARRAQAPRGARRVRCQALRRRALALVGGPRARAGRGRPGCGRGAQCSSG